MASLLRQLKTTLVVAIITNLLIWTGHTQIYEQYDDQQEETNENNLKNIFKLLLLSYFQDTSEDYSEKLPSTINSDLSATIFENERQIRSHNNENLGATKCIILAKRNREWTNSTFEYRPSTMNEETCEAVEGHVGSDKINVCYVLKPYCQTKQRKMQVFRRKRDNKSCWVAEQKILDVGCDCHFIRENLPTRTYNTKLKNFK